MIIDDRGPDGQLQVLLVRRTGRVVFGPHHWVFPGGRVDPDDHRADVDALCTGLDDQQASRLLDVDHGGLAWWVAAARETLEEAGLLLAPLDRVPPADRQELVAAIRREVLAEESRFAPTLIAHGLTLDLTPIEEVARFITPVGPPRRFDTRFFVAHAPSGQQPSHDEGEIVDHRWFTPADALARWRAGELPMMSPTVRMVACLDRYRTANAVMATARRRLPYRRVRVEDPTGAYRVLLPGEPGYEGAETDVESGWVRLWEHG
jgi:8-oxo-dGTP pyrophosphatase MutT (NUDIX family)